MKWGWSWALSVAINFSLLLVRSPLVVPADPPQYSSFTCGIREPRMDLVRTPSEAWGFGASSGGRPDVRGCDSSETSAYDRVDDEGPSLPCCTIILDEGEVICASRIEAWSQECGGRLRIILVPKNPFAGLRPGSFRERQESLRVMSRFR